MYLLLLASLLYPVACNNVTSGGVPGLPGIKLHLTPRGVQYLSSEAGEALNKLIESSSSIPDASTDYNAWFGEGSLSSRDVAVQKFLPPTYLYQNNPNNRFVWRAEGGFLEVAGKWSASWSWFMRLNADGKFTAETKEDPKFAVSARFQKTSNGALEARDIECSANLGALSLSVRGDAVATLLGFFSDQIAAAVRPLLEAELCRLAKEYVKTTINTHLRAKSFDVMIIPGMTVDLSHTDGLQLTGGSVESWHRANVFHENGTNLTTPFHPHPMQRTGQSDKMLYTFVSDYFFNSVLYQSHQFNISRLETSDVDRTSGIAKFLRPRCHVLCLGTIFPEIEKRYPNADGVLDLRTTSPPTVLFKNDKAEFRAEGYINVLGVHKNGEKSRIFGSQIVLEADVEFSTINEKGKHPVLVYQLKIKSLSMESFDSDIISENETENVKKFLHLSTPVAERLLNEYAEDGIVLALAAGTRLENATVTVLDRTIEIASDFVLEDYDDEI